MQNSRRPVSETFLYFLRGATVGVFIQSRYKCSSDNVTIEPKQLRPGQILHEFNLVDLVRCNDLSLFKKATISDFYFRTVAPGRTYLHCSRKKMLNEGRYAAVIDFSLCNGPRPKLFAKFFKFM